MNPIEASFLHPATLFVILGIILPFLRGGNWRVLLFIPPVAAIFLTLHMHLGRYWEVDYVGQVLVLGRGGCSVAPLHHSVRFYEPYLYHFFFSCA